MKYSIWGNCWIALTFVMLVSTIRDMLTCDDYLKKFLWSNVAIILAWGLLCRIDDKVKEWRGK
jgi:hypothetical protein